MGHEMTKKIEVGPTIVSPRSGRKFHVHKTIVGNSGKQQQRFVLGVWEGFEHLGEVKASLKHIRSGASGGTKNFQRPGKFHVFTSCGCSGILPKKKGQHNKFVRWNGSIGRQGTWVCRLTHIISGISDKARNRKYAPLDNSVTHPHIRKLMEDPNCVVCRKPLKWVFKLGKTPHLHHDHYTGKVFGFAHANCNPRALEKEILRLKGLILALGRRA